MHKKTCSCSTAGFCKPGARGRSRLYSGQNGFPWIVYPWRSGEYAVPKFQRLFTTHIPEGLDLHKGSSFRCLILILSLLLRRLLFFDKLQLNSVITSLVCATCRLWRYKFSGKN